MADVILPEKIKANLGPPSYLETLLADIGTGKGQIAVALKNFLTLPYVNAMKVTNRAGVEVSLFEQVNKLKDKYEKLQDRSVPIVNEISAYARFSELILPTVNQPQGLTLDEMLLTNVPLVMRYGKEAKQLAKETNELKAEFQDLLEVLEHNLAEVLKQLSEQEKALEEAEKEYAYEKATAIISGIITLGFLIGAGVALCMGFAPVAAELAVHAGIALYDMIKDAIKAAGLAKVIINLKTAIETSKQTKKNLEELIPAFKNIVSLLEKVGSAWDAMQLGLAEVKDNYTVWSNPALFTPEMLAMTLESWKSIRVAAELYIRTITGASDDTESNSAPKPMALMMDVAETEVEHAQANHNDSDAELLSNRMDAIDLTSQDIGAAIARKIFMAPSVTGQLLRKEDLERVAQEYGKASEYLRAVGQNGLAQTCDSAVGDLTQYVIPANTKAIDAMRNFAAPQPQIPSFPIDQAEWETFCAVRMSTLQQGKDSVEASYNSAHGLQYKVSVLSDTMIARVKELRIMAEGIDYEIREQQEKRRQYEVRLNMPFGFIFNEIIRQIRTVLEALLLKRTQVNSEMQQIGRIVTITEQTAQHIAKLWDLTKDQERFWNDLLAGMVSGSTVWTVLNKLKLTPGEIAIYKATWDQVRIALGDA